MTDNTKFKKDTINLYRAIQDYKRDYRFMGGSRVLQSPVELLEAQLRVVLEVLRTDEENAAQHRADNMC